MKLSDGEKLIAVMLADMIEATSAESAINPPFTKHAIYSGHSWAIVWEYPEIFGDAAATEQIRNETMAILDMCRVVGTSIDQLNDDELATIPIDKREVFVGFDGNDGPHHGVAKMFIEHMNRWTEFADRPLNSHSMVLEAYRRKLAAYEKVGGASASPMKLSEIQAILAT